MIYILSLIFIVLPIFEIWILIKLGSAIGFWGTLFLVFGTAILGILHIRMQGFGLIFNLQKKILLNIYKWEDQSLNYLNVKAE